MWRAQQSRPSTCVVMLLIQYSPGSQSPAHWRLKACAWPVDSAIPVSCLLIKVAVVRRVLLLRLLRHPHAAAPRCAMPCRPAGSAWGTRPIEPPVRATAASPTMCSMDVAGRCPMHRWCTRPSRPPSPSSPSAAAHRPVPVSRSPGGTRHKPSAASHGGTSCNRNRHWLDVILEI